MGENAKSGIETETTPHSTGDADYASTMDEWVDEHADYLFRFAKMRVRDSHVAEELVQETFVAAIKAESSFRGDSSPKTWLTGLLRHKIADHFRRLRRERPVEVLAHDEVLDSWFDAKGMWLSAPSQASLDPAQIEENEDFWAIFEGCLKGLPDRLADAFALRVMDEMASDEVCKVLSVSPTNLWVILHRARARLRSCLEANWFDVEPGKTN